MSGKTSQSALIKNGAFVLKIGPFSVRVQSSIMAVHDGIDQLYGDYPRLTSDSFCDFYVRLFPPLGLRRLFRKQVLFAFDQFTPFKPLPYAQAYPLFEWGLNWCIAGYSHQYLIIHAAVVERYGKALILPGAPGSGKSTLCASLINSGWRLLSDELTLIDCVTGNIVPVPRPVSLKNQSIEIIRKTYPQCIFSPIVRDTLKGEVSLMKPPASAVLLADQIASPCLVVFPNYGEGVDLVVKNVSRGEAFMRLADLSFNYSTLGYQGFDVLAGLIARCRAYDFVYSGDFNQARACFDQLINEQVDE
ncbi:HprK-related kinase A [Methylomonas sp. MgM2]